MKVVLALVLVLAAAQAQQIPAVVKVATMVHEPYLSVVDDTASGNARYSGYIKDLLDELSRSMRFRYELVLPEDEKYGSLDEATGEWSGLVGMVAAGKADFVAADLTVTAKRADVLDFTMPFMSSQLTVLATRSPSSSGPAVDFLSVFGVDAWLLLLVAFLLTAAVLLAAARIAPAERENFEGGCCGYGNALWFTFACFFRGSNYAPKACSTRLLIASWFLFGVAVVVLYACGLRNQLAAANAPSAPVALSVEDLLERPGFRFLAVKGGSTNFLLENSADPVHQEIFSSISSDPEANLVAGNEAGRDLVVAEGSNTGFVVEGASAEYFMGQDCDLYSVGNLHQRSYALAFKRDSPIRSLFTRGILQLRNQARLQMLRNKWWRASADCQDSGLVGGVVEGACAEKLYDIDVTDLACPLIFLLVVLFVALIASIAELASHISRNRDTEAPLSAQLKVAFCGCCKKEECVKAAPEVAE